MPARTREVARVRPLVAVGRDADRLAARERAGELPADERGPHRAREERRGGQRRGLAGRVVRLEEGHHHPGPEDEAVARGAAVRLDRQEVPGDGPEREPLPPPRQHLAEDALGGPADPVAVRHRVHGAGPEEQEPRERLAGGGARPRGEHHLARAVAAGQAEHVDPGRAEPLDGALELLGRRGLHHLAVVAEHVPEPAREPGLATVAPRQRVAHDADAAMMPCPLEPPRLPPRTGDRDARSGPRLVPNRRRSAPPGKPSRALDGARR